MRPSNNSAGTNLEGTLSRLRREDTDVWRASNLLTSRKENAVNQLGVGGWGVEGVKKCENCNDLETVNHS